MIPPDFFERLVHDAPDGIVYADRDGTIRYWNQGAERIFGFTAEEALGQSLDIIIPDRLRAAHWDGYRRTMQSGVTRYGAGDVLAVPAQRKDGTRISIEFTVQTFSDTGGDLLGIAAVMRDVTKRFNELKALRERLAAQSGAAKS